jgi:hypothetical protein
MRKVKIHRFIFNVWKAIPKSTIYYIAIKYSYAGFILFGCRYRMIRIYYIVKKKER